MPSLKERARISAEAVLASLARRKNPDHIHVLMYHRVLPEPEASGYPLANLVIPLEQFEAQAAWLSRRARVLPLHEALSAEPAGQPTVCLTFDDGYADNARHAAPVLEALGLRATFYIATGFVESGGLWFDGACEVFARDRAAVERACEAHGIELPVSLDGWLGALKGVPASKRGEILVEAGAPGRVEGCGPMTIDELRGLAERGHEIGAHTVTHPILTMETPERVREELVGSKRTLESWIGRDVPGFCYPNGLASDEVRETARAAGYDYACVVGRGSHRPGADDPFGVRRRFVSRWNSSAGGVHSDATFACEVLGVHDAARRLRQGLRG